MHFLTLMLAFGACVLIAGPLATQANPQLNPGGITCLSSGKCNQGQICCPGQVKCPKTGDCPPLPGAGAFGGKLGFCLSGKQCFKGDQCCKNAMPCPVKGSGSQASGFCPKA